VPGQIVVNDPNRKISSGDARAAAVAWTLPFTLVVPMVVGGGVGYLLDHWLHAKVAFMLILGLAGLVLGVRDAMKTASLLDKK
jgi:F0F1-type ATP synthase assembly protein I